MHYPPTITSIGCVLGLISLASTGRADDLTTTVTQGAGHNWNEAIWQTNGTGTLVGPPVAGNTYQCVFNGTAFGASTANTRIRNPASAGLQTFPGDSLTLNTNTEIRMKAVGAILNFPGVGGNPGLILNGGVLNAGDDTVFAVTGIVQVASQSYMAPGDNGGGAVKPLRGFDITGQLTGSGTMMIFQSTTNTAQRISGESNTFSGEWIVKAGRLLGAGNNSLGTNSITIDPNYTLPPDFGTITDLPGPAALEVNYDLNSAGVLTLVNGGVMWLHQNCAFTAVTIEGTQLSPGTHFYAELLANFPGNFLEGGVGSLTVQPYGTLPKLKPQIGTQPSPQMLYAARNATFAVAATGQGPLAYQWRKNGTPLTNGGSISGSTTASLTISNVSAGDAGSYDVIVSNQAGPTTSSAATLTIVTPSGEAYENAVIAANPVDYYRLDETSDPAVSALAFDYAGGHVGTYGTGVLNGNPAYNIAGPTPVAGFSGFAANNKAAQFANGTGTSRITLSPWNLNTNTVTIAAWVNPSGPQVAYAALAFCRGGGTVAGLNYSAGVSPNNNMTLGYHWNNEADTYNWNSGLETPPGQWSLVALVVAPTSATIHVMNTNGLVSSSHVYNHVVQAFGGTTLLGDDSNDGGNGTRVFNGIIDDVTVFNRALTPGEVAALYSAASGVNQFPPAIGVQPASQTLYAQQTATFAVGAGGSEPLSFQWQAGTGGVFSDLADGGRVSGATTATLSLSSIAAGDALDYRVVITNAYGSVTSSVATLTVQAVSPAENITMSVQQAAGHDWNTGADWSDGLAASESAAAKPGSTYEVLAGARLRTPTGATYAVFPGDVLTLDGNATWSNNPAAGSPIAEIRFKQPNPGTVTFKKLVMNGGQLDSGNPGIVTIGGEIDILTNTPIYNDDGSDRGYKIDAWLTGSASIEYHGYNQTSFRPAYVNNLNIAGTSNTYSGTWNVVLGTLLGTGPNALGTNNITVGANGALETTYDINNPKGSLLLNGRMYLHQNDTFRSVSVGGVDLSPGTYTFAQLVAVYPANFPSNWTQQAGSPVSTASGSITVLGNAPPPVTLQIQAAGANLQLSWSQGILLEADTVTGPWTTNNASSPYLASPTGVQKFYRVLVQ